MIQFFVHGEPAAQGSKRHVGNGRMVEMSKKLPKWRAAVKEAAATAHQGKPPIDAPVRVTARFFMPKPKRPMFPVPATAPDLDKLQRALGDSLEAAGVIRNDSRIVQWIAEKCYASKGGEGVEVSITLAP